jgi:predicted PurR-regulated permease PerM
LAAVQLAGRHEDDEEKAPDGERPAKHAPTPLPFPVPVDIRSVALTGLFVLALFFSAYVAQAFLVPLTIAVLLSFVFSPLVRRLKRARVAPALSGAVVVMALVATIASAGYWLSGPASTWIARAPESVEKIQARLQKLRRPLDKVTATAAEVEKLADVTQSAADRRVMTVQLKGRSIGEVLFGSTQQLLGSLLVVFVLLYFLLASGDMFLTKLIRVLPKLEDKKRAVQIARETEDHISHYLIVVTLINLGFGAAIAIAMGLLGLPNAVLWGALAAVTNFVPYLGAVAMAVICTLVALLQFEDTSRVLLVPTVFLALNLVEGYLLTPMLVGRKLTLNPVVVFVGVLFWGWIWGVMGAILAVPILAAFKIVCDHVEGLTPIGELLGD